MKTSLLIITFLFLVSVAGGQNLVATTDVASDFWVNETMLPAGHYQVTSQSMGGILKVENTNSGQVVEVFFRPVNQATPCAQSKFVFATNNGRQTLHRICRAGDRYALDLSHPSDVYNPVLPE